LTIFAIKSWICSTVIKLKDPPFLSLQPFFEWTSSLEVSLWTDALSSSSLSELFAKDQAGRFPSFLVSLAIFSSYDFMRTSFSLLSLTSHSSMAFLAVISSSKLFVPIVMTGMTTVLEDSALVSDWKICLSDGEEGSLLYYSSPLLHKVDLATLWGFGLYPSNKTLFAASLAVWVKVPQFV